jgi:hypothetical protein
MENEERMKTRVELRRSTLQERSVRQGFGEGFTGFVRKTRKS